MNRDSTVLRILRRTGNGETEHFTPHFFEQSSDGSTEHWQAVLSVIVLPRAILPYEPIHLKFNPGLQSEHLSKAWVKKMLGTTDWIFPIRWVESEQRAHTTQKRVRLAACTSQRAGSGL